MSTVLRVLIVEDSESDALLLVHQLEREGYRPTFERVDTPQAMRAALVARPWDLILADYSLPAFSAPDALALVHELELDLPLIIVSGTIDEAIAVDVLRAGAHDFILKGNWARLGPAIARALRDAAQRRERQRAEAALVAQERRFQAIVEHSSDATWLLDAQGQVVYTSPAATRILGDLSASQVSADRFSSVHPDDRLAVSAILEAAGKAPGRPVTIQYRIRQQDGSWHWLEATFTNLLDEPSVAALVVNAQDITERRRAEDQWRLTEEILRRIQSLVVLTDRDGAVTFVNEAVRDLLGLAPAELLGDQWWQATYADPAQAAEDRERVMAVARGQAQVGAEPYEKALKTRTGDVRWLLWQVAQGPGDTLIAIGHDITERKRAEAQFRLQGAALAAAANAIAIVDPQGTITWVNPAFTQLTGYTADEAVGQSTRLLRSGVHDAAFYETMWRTVLSGQVWQGELINRRKDGRLYTEEQVITPVLDEAGKVEYFISIKQDVTRRKQAEEQTQTQLRQLAALHTVGVAITSSLDVQVTLAVLLQQVVEQLGADAADVLLLRPNTQSLEYMAGRGFRTRTLERTQQRLGEGHAGRAALERRTVHVPDLRKATPQLRRTGLLVSQEFVNYFGVPLIAKGQVQGVLEVFHRRPLVPDAQWQSFLEALASQAAIAVDNALLFEELQQSNTQLALAYEATIEGWSRAMDLRDKETEGHTRRVTELTLLLARTLGIPDEEIVHIRRGALLHDIGKMGVPDAILLKPGPLTDAEWGVMRQHPVLAYEMLAPIAYLRSALDIPYSHHEKWDGTGYPRQLKGEAIPLSARIFAVADVWDALRSDRPYRSAWPEARVREHIRALSGTHFDPRVVAAFLQVGQLPA